MNSENIIVLGAGGHAKVVINVLLNCDVKILGLIACQPFADTDWPFPHIKILGDDEILDGYLCNDLKLVNAVGSIKIRYNLFNYYKACGYTFKTIIDPRSCIATLKYVGEGIQILSGACVQTYSSIHENVIINTGAIVEHDCIIGAHSHISPGAVICGGVKVGKRCHIGAGATILENITIGDDCQVGAGAVVLRDLVSSTRAVGVPAKKLL